MEQPTAQCIFSSGSVGDWKATLNGETLCFETESVRTTSYKLENLEDQPIVDSVLQESLLGETSSACKL